MLAERTEIPTWLRDDWQSRAATRGVHGQSVEEVHHRVDEEEGHQSEVGVVLKCVPFDELFRYVSHRPDDGSYEYDSVEVGDRDHDKCETHGNGINVGLWQIILEVHHLGLVPQRWLEDVELDLLAPRTRYKELV